MDKSPQDWQLGTEETDYKEGREQKHWERRSCWLGFVIGKSLQCVREGWRWERDLPEQEGTVHSWCRPREMTSRINRGLQESGEDRESKEKGWRAASWLWGEVEVGWGYRYTMVCVG